MKFIPLILCFYSFYTFSSEFSFSESTIPYIQNYSDVSAQNGYNVELTKTLNRLKCGYKKKDSQKVFWDNYTKIGYAKNKIISIKIRSNYNCDGLHSNNDIDSSITYDMENNRRITLFDIFLKKPKTYNFIRESYYKNVTDENCRDKVDYYLESEKLFKEYLNFYLDKKEIVFKLKLPHGLRFCLNELKISYTELLNNTAYTGILKKLEEEFLKKED